MKKQLAGISLALMTIAGTAQAAVVIATSSQTNGSNSLPHSYVPSSTDLINGLAV